MERFRRVNTSGGKPLRMMFAWYGQTTAQIKREGNCIKTITVSKLSPVRALYYEGR